MLHTTHEKKIAIHPSSDPTPNHYLSARDESEEDMKNWGLLLATTRFMCHAWSLHMEKKKYISNISTMMNLLTKSTAIRPLLTFLLSSVSKKKLTSTFCLSEINNSSLAHSRSVYEQHPSELLLVFCTFASSRWWVNFSGVWRWDETWWWWCVRGWQKVQRRHYANLWILIKTHIVFYCGFLSFFWFWFIFAGSIRLLPCSYFD